MTPGRALVLLAALVVAPIARAEDPIPADVRALVRTWLEAAPDARAPLAERIRAAGVPAARALQAECAQGPEAERRRVEALLERVREDFHRREMPAGMVYIPAGSLEVPRTAVPWGASGERTAVDAFYLDRTEVTVGAWRTWIARVAAEEGDVVAALGLPEPAADVDARLPMTGVRHAEAERFARAHGGRLPTAEEFERAVRGSGLATWPWGERMRAERCNLQEDGAGAVVPVGTYPLGASPFGALDLVGNVAEWSATTVAQGTRGRYPLLLGGSYIDAADEALTWRGSDRMRARTSPRERQPWIGFRVARDAPALPD
ncbi:MAG: SUMF1/EgtB/PvdO family nonheme iron enzyme [Planctomycetota bacterium]|nr:SUMF1/EgtB/PvdO family nonheme iron enzyme [Planctomycetota bacterium]